MREANEFYYAFRRSGLYSCYQITIEKVKPHKFIAAVMVILCLSGCSAVEPEVEHTRYALQGRYYVEGVCEDVNGNIWDYTTDTVSKLQPYDGMPIYICFDDAGTPDNIYDDEIIGIVYDRETAIYDNLETSLSESFTIKRDSNVIHIEEEE